LATALITIQVQLWNWGRNGACSWWLRCCLCLLGPALFWMTVWLAD
jgi:hypothetical protein